jgi:hypothetical protein
LRNGEDIKPVIRKTVLGKYATRGGMHSNEQFNDPEEHKANRSMIRIGG